MAFGAAASGSAASAATFELRGERGVLGGLPRGGLLERLAALGLASASGALVGRALAPEPDVGDPEDRQLLAVALLHAAARLRAVLEGDDLVATGGAQDLGLDGGAVDDGGADGGLGPVGDEEHALQRDRLAGLDVEQLNLELGADLDAVLLPAGLDDCVHGSSEESDGGRVATAARTC